MIVIHPFMIPERRDHKILRTCYCHYTVLTKTCCNLTKAISVHVNTFFCLLEKCVVAFLLESKGTVLHTNNNSKCHLTKLLVA